MIVYICEELSFVSKLQMNEKAFVVRFAKATCFGVIVNPLRVQERTDSRRCEQVPCSNDEILIEIGLNTAKSME